MKTRHFRHEVLPRHAMRALTLALLLVLGVGTAADADCAWLLWMRNGAGWLRIGAYPSYGACWQHITKATGFQNLARGLSRGTN